MRTLSVILLVAGSILCSAFTPNNHLLFDENNKLSEEKQYTGGGAIVIIPFNGGMNIEVSSDPAAIAEVTVYAKSGEVLLVKYLNTPDTYRIVYADFHCEAALVKVELADKLKEIPVTRC